MDVHEAILGEIRSGRLRTKNEVQAAKLRLARQHNARMLPTDADLWQSLPPAEREAYRPLLQLKPTRTASGVAIVTVQISPSWCPHGTCTYCPGGPNTNSAKSYTGFEPAAQRAARLEHDPYAQTADRIRQLRTIGHPTDKVDFIVQGGTFTARDVEYQRRFLQRCYDALNDEGRAEAGSADLEDAMRRNETAPSRMIGLTIETKPDWALEAHLDVILDAGATRLELGAQTLQEDVLERVHRGHTLDATRRATQLAKDAGLKLVYHMMPGLPGSDPQRDVEDFRRLFADQAFRPDMLKIYPTLVIKGTALFEEWQQGKYEPYHTATAARVIAEAKRHVPPWVRIMRIDRDIPVPMIEAGIDKSNVREIALDLLRREYGVSCRCIRCREVGLRALKGDAPPRPEDLELVRRDYDASGGQEVFLAYEDPARDLIAAYLRLRVLARPHRAELAAEPSAMVRELKVNGPMVPIGDAPLWEFQHRGLGQRLLDEAWRLTRDEFGLGRLFVISGPGVKPYYRRFGYRDAGAYLVRDARNVG
ncbi:MAG: tRNA uridine(34) 5-carboxymethylaminomethyl modification radical SAM/GNAT enzyme Elp3 [Euryarchaeota archaeon]|nr:tRNA uridine(34) 5-carboxymethylaminomethyl modification radical SAM/GNAT enzyme Elp3 [Euryarchaeota archaeon]